MKIEGKLLFLGTGASAGVPLIGCECPVCTSPSPYNKRMRPSALVNINKKQFLIDAGPDFRTQALRSGIKNLDGVLFTHAHHDHTAGIDDLRIFSYRNKAPLPTLLSIETADEIKKRFDYIFQPTHHYETSIPKMELTLLPNDEGTITFQGIPISYVTYEQGGMKVNGFRFGDLAYLSDIRKYQPSIFKELQGVKNLIISALRHTTSPLHFSVGEAIKFIDEVGAETAWLTHISHDLDYEQTNADLPDHIKLAYDGLEINFG